MLRTLARRRHHWARPQWRDDWELSTAFVSARPAAFRSVTRTKNGTKKRTKKKTKRKARGSGSRAP